MDGWPELRLIERPHGGKGAAIRAGILVARGALALLADADFSMSADQIERFSHARLGDYAIAIAVREGKHAQRIGEPLPRRLMSRAFNVCVRMTLLPGFHDTQCGFKCLRLEVARELAACQTREGWGFDVEQLFIARQQRCIVREAPIVWQYVAGSHVRPVSAALSMLRDVLVIRWNAARGLYGARSMVDIASPPVSPSAMSHANQAS